MKYLFSIAFLLVFNVLLFDLYAAPVNIDSLKDVLKKADDTKKPELYLKIAKGYTERRSYDESIDYLNKAIKLSGGHEKNEIIMRVYYALGDNYLYKNDFDNTFKCLFKSLEIANAISEKEFQLEIYLLIAQGYQYKFNYDESINYCNKAIEFAAGLENNNMMEKIYFVRGNDYYIKGNIEKALKDYFKALEIAKIIKSMFMQSDILNAIGVAYKTKGEYQKSIEYYQQNFKVQEALGDSAAMGRTLNNIGNVYWSFGINKKAIEYYEKSMEIFQNLHLDNYVGFLLINIGIGYAKSKDNNKAIEYLRKSYAVFQKINLKKGMAQAQSEMGTIYSENGNFQMALKYQEEALAIFKAIGENMNTAMTLRYIAETYNKAGNLNTALNYFKMSLDLEKQTGLKKEMLDNYKDIAVIYSKLDNYRNAYLNFQQYSNLKDSTLGEDYLKQIQELEAKYDADKKEKEIQLQKSEISKKDLEAKRKNILLFGVGLIAIMILVFSFIIFKQYSEKKKANILLAEQNDEIKKQRDQIFQQKKEITDSIHYASRIQRAVLPSPKLLEEYGLQYFILYKPRDIVSGDFYWMNQKDNKVIIAAADCTGHGVPGAFMSMLGMALLNEIVSKGEFQNAAQILDQLRNLVVKSLHQSGKSEETKDGMDISLCMIDKDSGNIQFAGAFNSLFLIRNKELQEANADRMPVGFHDKLDVPFTNTQLDIQKGDNIYIFSDGYIDQFGGENGKKFMAKKFKQLLVSIQDQSMERQRETLDNTITDWRGELDQVDDIMVIGLKV